MKFNKEIKEQSKLIPWYYRCYIFDYKFFKKMLKRLDLKTTLLNIIAFSLRADRIFDKCKNLKYLLMIIKLNSEAVRKIIKKIKKKNTNFNNNIELWFKKLYFNNNIRFLKPYILETFINIRNNECPICFEKIKNINIILDCCHIVCNQCYKVGNLKVCPICRIKIIGNIKIKL